MSTNTAKTNAAADTSRDLNDESFDIDKILQLSDIPPNNDDHVMFWEELETPPPPKVVNIVSGKKEKKKKKKPKDKIAPHCLGEPSPPPLLSDADLVRHIIEEYTPLAQYTSSSCSVVGGELDNNVIEELQNTCLQYFLKIEELTKRVRKDAVINKPMFARSYEGLIELWNIQEHCHLLMQNGINGMQYARALKECLATNVLPIHPRMLDNEDRDEYSNHSSIRIRNALKRQKQHELQEKRQVRLNEVRPYLKPVKSYCLDYWPIKSDCEQYNHLFAYFTSFLLLRKEIEDVDWTVFEGVVDFEKFKETIFKLMHCEKDFYSVLMRYLRTVGFQRIKWFKEFIHGNLTQQEYGNKTRHQNQNNPPPFLITKHHNKPLKEEEEKESHHCGIVVVEQQSNTAAAATSITVVAEKQ